MSSKIAFDKAYKKASKECGTNLCGSCKGTGKLCIKIFNLDESSKESDYMRCVWCRGKGTKTPKEIFKTLISNYVWCTCEEDTDSFYSDDGQCVFGNDTYLCCECGMVTQFG